MGSRVLLCKSPRLTSLALSSLSPSPTHLRFESFVTITPSQPNLRFHRMAAKASSSLTNGETSKPPAEAAVSPSASSAIDFLTLCHRLKTTKRAGWVLRDVKQPESIADHMYRMGLMALISKDIPGVDRDKCIKMAIVHDIAEGEESYHYIIVAFATEFYSSVKNEVHLDNDAISMVDIVFMRYKFIDLLKAIVGDITPSDGVPKLEKSRLEREALDHMCKLLGGGSSAKEISELWMEYEENSSPEAKVVKDFDKVEMILQALEYEKEQGKNLDEFFESTAGKFQTEVGKAWASEIASRRGK